MTDPWIADLEKVSLTYKLPNLADNFILLITVKVMYVALGLLLHAAACRIQKPTHCTSGTPGLLELIQKKTCFGI
jgi:hypothetical protein